ncbi:MAG TPA: ATP-binding cassette domain-containing protein, partial [Mesotoga infera]|nr:ATP-binding cassette domain-containing protein [Mesotoga infera]
MNRDTVGSRLILEVKEISKSFPGVQALDRVDMDVREGEVHALLGENGSGKSTLTKCIVGAYQKDSGTILYDGKETSFSSPTESFRKGISVIYQERSLIPKFTVEQNIF